MSTWTPDWASLDAAMRLRLQRTAWAILHDEHEAEDAVQDAYVRALRGIGSLREPAAVCGWLHEIARHTAVDRLRRRRCRPELTDEVHEVPDRRAPGPSDAIEAAEAFARLPSWMRRALEQRARGMSLAESAAVEGISLAAAKTRLSRARIRLRVLVSP